MVAFEIEEDAMSGLSATAGDSDDQATSPHLRLVVPGDATSVASVPETQVGHDSEHRSIIFAW